MKYTLNTKLKEIIPEGKYCTGCPCIIMSITKPNKTYSWGYWCTLLRKDCETGGDCDEYGIKHKDCPSLVEK